MNFWVEDNMRLSKAERAALEKKVGEEIILALPSQFAEDLVHNALEEQITDPKVDCIGLHQETEAYAKRLKKRIERTLKKLRLGK